MINSNSFIFLIIAMLLWIEPAAGYKITTGKTNIVEKELDFIIKGDKQASNIITSYYRFFIFPYNVYEYHTRDIHNNTYFRNFLFVKNNFQNVQNFMNVQNSTVDLQNQIQILYQRIPEIIHVEGQNNELIDIDLIDLDLECKQFVIRNSTAEKIQNNVRIYDLNFYYLQINKYLLKVINVAYYKTSENQTAALLQDYELSFLEGKKSKTSEQLKKHKFVMENILANQTLWESQDFTSYLVYRVFSRRIRQTTKWKAIYDGFTIKYFSADIYRVNLVAANDNDYIELIRIQVNQGEIKQSTIIKEPLKYLKLQQLHFLDLCRSGEKINVLFTDQNLGYVIDITKEEWHLLQQIKVANMSSFKFAFFGKDCKVYGLHQRTQQKNQTSKKFSVIVQYHPKKQNIKKVDMLVTHFYKPFLNFLILCDAKNNCSMFETQKFKQINDILFNNKILTISNEQNVNYRVSMMDGYLKYLLQIIDLKQQKQRRIQISPNYTMTSSFSKSFLHPIYNSLVYRNKTKYISNEMNREVYQHIKETSFLQNPKQKQSYFQQIFSQKTTGQNCLVPFEFESTVAEVKFNQTKDWTVCVWQQEINQYTELILTFKERYLNYQMYLCASFLELYSDRMNIECVTLLDQIGQLAQTKTMSVIQQLRSSHFYKLYIVKHNDVQQKYLPTIFVKDVERQQIEVASTIFFFIMIVLSLLLLGLVLFITLKSVVINLLIYYGIVQERVQPSYPLAWFPLKTKLKRMQQHGVLKYVEYQPSLSDTQGNHCCFCLQLIRQRTVVAQIYCGHEFHKQCFKEWIKNQPNAKCPTCRRHFTRTGLMQYHHNMSSQQQLPISL